MRSRMRTWRQATLPSSSASREFSRNRGVRRLRSLMANYAFEVRDREWPMLVVDKQDLRARAFYIAALPIIAARTGQVASQQTAFEVLHSLSVHRRQRLIAADSGLPGGLYFSLILGGAIVVAFVFLFSISNEALQLTMTGLIVAMMGLLIGVIVSLDRPYTGAIRVSPQPWTLIIQNNDLARYRTSSVSTR